MPTRFARGGAGGHNPRNAMKYVPPIRTLILVLACCMSSALVTSAEEATVVQRVEKIAWFGTLESGRAEATRTARPIFLISARPECRGVPGFW